MDKIEISGGIPLNGNITISGAKNATLPLIAATILTDEPVTLNNVPNLSDVHTLLKLLQLLGAEVDLDPSNHTLTICSKSIQNFEAPYDLVRKMRASVLVLGPLLARFKKARVSLPGGCAIGVRPVDFHITGLRNLGANINIDEGYINASCSHNLIGSEIVFPKVSVTGTENIIMAATLAEGQTKLINAAIETEIVDLIEMLNSMGSEISYSNSREIIIKGKTSLHGTNHEIISDRIELGTYILTAGTVDESELILTGKNIAKLTEDTIGLYHSIGMQIDFIDTNTIHVKRSSNLLHGIQIETEPFPGFPTDLQAQLMVAMCKAGSESYIKETIWENRFMHVPELLRMGADITLIGNTAHIKPIKNFKNAPVIATDLRASFSLVMAGLSANGITTINRVYHIDRGYENVELKLSKCNAKIKRIK